MACSGGGILNSYGKTITLICPTRGRLEGVRRLLNSINRTAADFHNFELVFIYDTDDGPTKDALNNYKDEYTAIEMHIHVRPHDDNLSDAYYNWAWRQKLLHGDYYWVTGNDVVMVTDGWDTRVIHAMEQYLANSRSRVCCAFAADVSTNKPYLGFNWGWFPIFTKEAVQTVGYLFPKEYPTSTADVWMAKMYSAAGCYLEIPTVQIDTISHRTYKGVPIDNIARSMGARDRQANPRKAAFRNRGYAIGVDRLREALNGNRALQTG